MHKPSQFISECSPQKHFDTPPKKDATFLSHGSTSAHKFTVQQENNSGTR